MKKIVLALLLALCASSLNAADRAERSRQTIFNACMTKFNNALFCELFMTKFDCETKANAKIKACHDQYKDPKDLKEICDKIEAEEEAKCIL